MLNKTTYNAQTDKFTFEHTKEITDIHGNLCVVLDFSVERTKEELIEEIGVFEQRKADIQKAIDRLKTEKTAADNFNA